jgi:hypothetical protein
VLLTAALAACGDDNEAQGCKTDGDCRDSRVCVEGACVEPSDENNQTNNAQNNNNADNNADNNANSSPNNQNNSTASCAGDLDCANDEVCDQGACAMRACEGNPDCGSAQRFCYAELCRPLIECTDVRECAPYNANCQDGRCIPNCVVDTDCPDPRSQACVESVCLERCGGDGDCGRGEICSAGVCAEAECQGVGTEGCPEGERCDAGRCEPFTACEGDGDCLPDEICRANICEPRTRCVGDAQCPEGLQCLDNFCREVQACEGRDQCAEGEDCVGGRCVPFVCRGDEDCEGGQVCDGGDCVDPQEATLAERIVILTRPQAVPPGVELQLQAVALDEDGNLLTGQRFSWTSDNADAVDVGQETGLAVGGDEAGSANIVARLLGDDRDLVSAPLALTNPGQPDDGSSRVVVVDADSGAPLAGAVVVRGDEQVETNAQGVATFALVNGPQDLHVYADGHNSLSVIGTTSGDVIAPLSPQSGNARVGGLQGELDLSQVSSQGDVSLGLAGVSLSEELSQIDLQTLLGDSFNTRISVPGIFDQDFPLPGGLVLYGQVFGFNLNIKERYYSRSQEGLKVAWALGGLLDVNELIGLVQGGGGGGDAGGIIRQLLPYFENFDHGVQATDIEAYALVADGDDIDGDGDEDELRPDWDEFESLDLTPRVRQRLRTNLSAPGFGQFSANNGTFAVVVGGVINQGIGFVPLGINAAQDEDGDGVPEPVTLRMAPPHSGLSAGEYAILAITFDIDQFNAGLGGIDLPEDYSTVVWRGRNIPADLDFSQGFLDLPSAQWSGPSRQFSSQEVAEAELMRVTFVGPQGSWEVWLAADAGGFDLPQPPPGFQDWSATATVRVEAFSTRNNLGLDGVARTGALGRISTVSEAFSRAILAQ